MDRNTPERMTPEAALAMMDRWIENIAKVGCSDHEERAVRTTLAALAQRVESLEIRLAQEYLLKDAAEARADALEKEAGRLREFVRRCSYAHLFPVDGLKLSSEAKAALSEPSDDTPTPSEADDHGRR